MNTLVINLTVKSITCAIRPIVSLVVFFNEAYACNKLVIDVAHFLNWNSCYYRQLGIESSQPFKQQNLLQTV